MGDACIQMGKEKNETFCSQMILSVRKSEQINQKLLELVSHYSKVTKYVSIQKSITFLYSSNEQVEFEIENTIPIILATPK